MAKLFFYSVQEAEKAVKELQEILETMEEHGLGERKFYHADKVGIVEIACASIVYWLQIIQDVIGVKLFESHKFPGLHAWIENFKQVPVIQENLPDRDEMFAYIKARREKFVPSASINA